MPYTPTHSNPRRTIGFIVVLVLHVGIFWALQSGLATSIVQVVKGPLQAELVKEPEKEEEPPPPPPPKLNQPPPPSVIMPEINIEAPAAVSQNTITVSKPQPAPPAPVADKIVPPRSNPRRPVTQPEYPPTSKRLGEVGTVQMLLTVNEDGKVIEAKLDKSSGYERLDNAAIQEALRAWRLLPGTRNGKPETMTYRFQVTFKITD